jgi:hypothetical protein
MNLRANFRLIQSSSSLDDKETWLSDVPPVELANGCSEQVQLATWP